MDCPEIQYAPAHSRNAVGLQVIEFANDFQKRSDLSAFWAKPLIDHVLWRA
jgi:hypothetical protein